MMEKHNRSIDQTRWVLTNCPGTGEEVVGSCWNAILPSIESMVKWWKCPSCEGWHLVSETACSRQTNDSREM